MHTCRSLTQITTGRYHRQRPVVIWDNDLGILERMQDGVHSSTTGTSARSWWTPTPASGTAFTELLCALEALPEAFLAGKAWIFITELRLLHLRVHSSPVMLGC